ncbi:hypothetical protein pb186bvf_017146 [Paramecium bursaria]
MDQSSQIHNIGIIIDGSNVNQINQQTFLNFQKQYPSVNLQYIKRIERGLQLEGVRQIIEHNYYSSIYFLEFPIDLIKELEDKHRDEINKLKEQIEFFEERLQEKKKLIISRDERIDDLTSIISQINQSQDQILINNLLEQNNQHIENDLIESIKELQKSESRYQGSEKSENYGLYQQLFKDKIKHYKSEINKQCNKEQKLLFDAFLYASKVYMEIQFQEQQQQNKNYIKIFEI